MLTILIITFIVVFSQQGNGSFSSLRAGDGHRHLHQRGLLSPAVSSYDVSHGNTPPPSQKVQTSKSRVIHVTDYGADPSGRSDSTDAIDRALREAFQSSSIDGQLMKGIANLGGTQIHLDGGTYTISRPLRLPLNISAGNLMIHGGSLRASEYFPNNRHMIELSLLSSSFSCEDISIKDLLIDCNFKGGGIAATNSLRTTIDNCYISHFNTTGISIKGGHETFIRNSFIGQHINVGGDKRERYFSGIGIEMMGNDNVVTDVVIFSAAIGIMVTGQANVFTGVHCYNKATGFGGTGIYVKAPGFSQIRILNSYFDYTGIVAEDPVQLQISGCFFLGNAFVLIRSVKGVLSGVNIVDNMFSGDNKHVPIVQLDQKRAPFSSVNQVVVDRNNARGMTVKSTVARGSVRGNGTAWTVDFSQVLLFPNLIKNVQYSLLSGGASFPRYVLRSVSRNRVTVESDSPLSATLHVSVDQS